MSIAQELVVLAEDLARSDDVATLEHRYLNWVRGRLPGSAFGIYVFHSGTKMVEACATSGVSDFFLSRYEEAGRAIDPLLMGVVAHAVTTDNLGIMTAREWKASPVYHAVYGLHGFGRALQAPIITDGHVVGTLNFGDRAADAFDEGAVDVMGALGRAVGLALTNLRGREQVSHERRTLRLALELIDQPVIMTDVATGVRYRNAAAERVCVRVGDRDDLVWFEDLLADGEIRDGLHRACGRVVDRQGCELTIQVRTVVPDGEPRLRISLLTCDEDASPRVPAAVSAMLSPREREIAALVAAGLQDPEIAARLYLSPYTVKGYVKSTYRKLGVKSRVELTRLVLSRSAVGEG